MSYFVLGILKSFVLEAQSALLLLDRVLLDRFRWQRKWAFCGLAALMVLAWDHFGAFQGVHEWEQLHFYFGAKYQKEVGWFDLYHAIVLADRETTQLIHVDAVRDLHTFEPEPMQQVLADAPRVRARFSPERWEAFKRDWVEMSRHPLDMNQLVMDHGNSNSPAWSVIVHPLTQLLPLTHASQVALGTIDLLLMAVMFFFLFQGFGARVGAIGLLMWAAPPNSFEYLSGSILRWDWLFALGLALYFMKKERWVVAGAFFGYAVASKLFPVFFGLALLVKALVTWRQERKLPRRYVRFGAGAVGSGAAFVLLAAMMFGGFGCWRDYFQRIEVNQHERYYGIQYSLRTVYLQFAESSPSEVAHGWFLPAEIKQARGDVRIEDHAVGFAIAQVLFTILVVLALLRADDVSAFAMGPLLVFCWLVVNMYYWNMLGLLALGLARREERPPFVALVTLQVPFMVFYVYQHLNRGYAEGYVVGLFLCLWMILFAALEGWEARGMLRGLWVRGAPAAAKVKARAA